MILFIPRVFIEDLAFNSWNLQIADVWSCGVTLYVMLVGAYPFEDPEDPKNFRKTITVCPLTIFFFNYFPSYQH